MTRTTSASDSPAGTEPVWSSDEHELFYRSLRAGKVVLTAAAVRTQPKFGIASQRDILPIDDMVGAQPHANYDVSPDGRTFAMVRRSPGNHIVVLQNVPALLRRLRGAAAASP